MPRHDQRALDALSEARARLKYVDEDMHRDDPVLRAVELGVAQVLATIAVAEATLHLASKR